MDSLLSGTECRTRGRALRRAAQCMAAALLCMLLLCACDPYNGYRPYDYGEARWTCEEYGAWFEIKEKEAIYGEVMVDGKAVEVEYAFYFGCPSNSRQTSSGIVTGGQTCGLPISKYSPTELVLHSPTVNYLFDEDDEEVVFVRQELDEEPAA